MPRILASLSVVASVMALSACTVGPDYLPPSVTGPAAWSEDASRLDLGADSAERLTHWWTSFNDPELDRLVAQAIAGNHDIKIAGQRVLAARADSRIAAAGFYPSLSTSAMAQRAQQSKDLTLPQVRSLSNSFQAGFDASPVPSLSRSISVPFRLIR